MLDSKQFDHTIQGSEAWKSWRKNKVGSSDASAIMNASPWMTPRQLWMEKCGFAEFDQTSWATERGQEVEPLVRELIEKQFDLVFSPLVVDNSLDYPFMAASLDGFNFETRTVLEIKVPDKEVFELCKKGEVHEKYIWQLEHQLFVTNAEKVLFVCARAEKDGASWKITDHAIAQYFSDPEKRKALIEAEKAFWAHVITKVPPPLTERDVLVRTEPEVRELYLQMKNILSEMKKIEDSLKIFEEQKASLKERMINQMIHNKEEAHGVRLQKRVSKTIDAEKLKESGVDIEPFQKERVSYTVTLIGE